MTKSRDDDIFSDCKSNISLSPSLNHASVEEKNCSVFVPGEVENFWECSYCKYLPTFLRPKDTVVFSISHPQNDSLMVQRHSKICKEKQKRQVPKKIKSSTQDIIVGSKEDCSVAGVIAGIINNRSFSEERDKFSEDGNNFKGNKISMKDSNQTQTAALNKICAKEAGDQCVIEATSSLAGFVDDKSFSKRSDKSDNVANCLKRNKKSTGSNKKKGVADIIIKKDNDISIVNSIDDRSILGDDKKSDKVTNCFEKKKKTAVKNKQRRKKEESSKERVKSEPIQKPFKENRISTNVKKQNKNDLNRVLVDASGEDERTEKEDSTTSALAKFTHFIKKNKKMKTKGKNITPDEKDTIIKSSNLSEKGKMSTAKNGNRSKKRKVKDTGEICPLVEEVDKECTTTYDVIILEQFKRVTFSNELDGQGRYRFSYPDGYPGIQCKHCKDNEEPRRMFHSNSEVFCNGFYHLEKHLMAVCKNCPSEVKKRITQSKKSQRAERNRLITSTKNTATRNAFIKTVWKRMTKNVSKKKLKSRG
mmetsp:Transcript_62080/g.72584  ORF Transcript_62080/g.72584 Transcript_62080/m.72584 type:complete len:532 (-) Transcript_62080:175-1770(-)